MRLKSRTRKGNHTIFVAGTAMGTVLPANDSRQIAILQNLGSATLFYGFSTAIGSGTALQLGSAGLFTLEQHTGPIYGLTAGGAGTVQVVELVESNAIGIQKS